MCVCESVTVCVCERCHRVCVRGVTVCVCEGVTVCVCERCHRVCVCVCVSPCVCV